jgi:hypothetical protein
MDGHLGRGMEGEARHHFVGECRDTGILHKHRIDTVFIEPDEVFQNAGDFPVMDKDIDSNIDTDTVGMSKKDRFPDLFVRKIGGKFTGPKVFPA